MVKKGVNDIKTKDLAFSSDSGESVILDFAGCRSLNDINLLLKDKFSLPDGVSSDWVKLWSFLEEKLCRQKGLNVELHGFYRLSEKLRKRCRFLIEIFENLQCGPENFTYGFVF